MSFLANRHTSWAGILIVWAVGMASAAPAVAPVAPVTPVTPVTPVAPVAPVTPVTASLALHEQGRTSQPGQNQPTGDSVEIDSPVVVGVPEVEQGSSLANSGGGPEEAPLTWVGETLSYDLEAYLLLKWVQIGRSLYEVLPPVQKEGKILWHLRATHWMTRFRTGAIVQDVYATGALLDLASTRMEHRDDKGRVTSAFEVRVDREALLVWMSKDGKPAISEPFVSDQAMTTMPLLPYQLRARRAIEGTGPGSKLAFTFAGGSKGSGTVEFRAGPGLGEESLWIEVGGHRGKLIVDPTRDGAPVAGEFLVTPRKGSWFPTLTVRGRLVERKTSSSARLPDW